MSYRVNEVFYSVQGEGVRAGEPTIFVRMANCNLKCAVEPGPKSPGGFDCDTEFMSGRFLTVEEIHDWILASDRDCRSLTFTGGEPALQVDINLTDYFRDEGYHLSIETNGSILLPNGMTEDTLTGARTGKTALSAALLLFPFDWIVVSPKVAEHAVKQLWAHEVRYVRGYGQGIPDPATKAIHYLISPAFDGLVPDERAIRWSIDLVKQNPNWRLSIQMHKLITREGVR